MRVSFVMEPGCLHEIIIPHLCSRCQRRVYCSERCADVDWISRSHWMKCIPWWIRRRTLTRFRENQEEEGDYVYDSDEQEDQAVYSLRKVSARKRRAYSPDVPEKDEEEEDMNDDDLRLEYRRQSSFQNNDGDSDKEIRGQRSVWESDDDFPKTEHVPSEN